MSDTVQVSSLPRCDLCPERAAYDAKTIAGPWAYLCQADFERYGIGLGTGRGQRLALAEEVSR